MTFIAAFTSVFMLACGSGHEENTESTLEAPASQVTPKADTVVQQVKALSIEAKKCLDLAKAGQYVEAIDPCERALRESSGAAKIEVQQAYDEAKAEIAQASKAAAIQAAAKLLEGTSEGEAAKGVMPDLMGRMKKK